MELRAKLKKKTQEKLVIVPLFKGKPHTDWPEMEYTLPLLCRRLTL